MPSVRYLEQKAWVHAVAISPDGERVASVDDSGQLRLWSPRDGRTLATVQVARTALYAVAFSPDGTELAVAGDDGTIERRTATGQATLATLAHHRGRVWSLAYSPDGKLLASGGEDGHVALWTLDGAPPRALLGHSQRVYSVAFSADGTQLASGSDDRRVWLWNVATGTGVLRGEHAAGGIRVVLFAGTSIISTGWDHEIRIWKAGVTAPEVWSDSHIVHGAALAPGGGVLVTAGEMDAIHAWDLSTHQLITSLEAPGGQISAVAFSRDGRWLVTAGTTPPIAWDATALARLAGVGHHAEVGGLAFSDDGTRLASGGGDHTLRLWDIATATELRRVSTGTAACGDGVVMIGDDLAAACGDHAVRRWRVNGTVDEVATDVWLRFTAVSPDHRVLAAGHAEGKLALIDVASWKITTEKTLHQHQIYGVQFAHDGRLVTAGLDDHVRTWRGPELAADLDVPVGAQDGELAGALAPDGKELATGTEVGTVDVWDVERRAWRTHVRMPTAGTVWKLVYSADGTFAATATNDGLVRVWSTRTWQDPIALDAGEGPALSLAIAPDGRRLAAGYQSGAIVLWDLVAHRLETRIGGRTRDRGSCAELASQAWVDEAHRAIVAAACAERAEDHVTRLAARSHQRIDGEVDATWDWLAPTH